MIKSAVLVRDTRYYDDIDEAYDEHQTAFYPTKGAVKGDDLLTESGVEIDVATSLNE